MATTTQIADYIEESLHVVAAEVADLPRILAEWENWPEHARVSYCLNWDQAMSTELQELDTYRRAGEMTAAQHQRYHELLRQLKRLLPLIERFDLYRPPVSLDV